MSRAKVIFHECFQDSQDFGSDDEHMISRLFFTMEIEGERQEDLSVDIKQTVGSDYETGSIEVREPAGYEGPFNHHAFRECAERYYRSCVGGGGSGINIQGGSNIRMTNNRIIKDMECEFDI